MIWWTNDDEKLAEALKKISKNIKSKKNSKNTHKH